MPFLKRRALVLYEYMYTCMYTKNGNLYRSKLYIHSIEMRTSKLVISLQTIYTAMTKMLIIFFFCKNKTHLSHFNLADLENKQMFSFFIQVHISRLMCVHNTHGTSL